MLVRKANATDAPWLQVLYLLLAGDACVLPEHISALSEDPRAALFVCQIDQVVVGTATVNLCRDVMYGERPFAVVENVVVFERLRGQGIGTALMLAVQQFCADARCAKIMVMDATGDTRVQHFFARAGYQGDVKRGFVRYFPQA